MCGGGGGVNASIMIGWRKWHDYIDSRKNVKQLKVGMCEQPKGSLLCVALGAERELAPQLQNHGTRDSRRAGRKEYRKVIFPPTSPIVVNDK